VIVVTSTRNGINHTQLVGDQYNNVIVPTYNWTEYFTRVFQIHPGIKSYQHFACSANEPGVLEYKM